MKNVKILDTTLRDGARLINNKIADEHIKGIVEGLTAAKVDIIELGFLRGNVDYNGNSTYFNDVEQFKRFIPEDRRQSTYVAFADYGKEFGMWDFSKLPECDGTSITGIRVGYRKNDLMDAIDTFNIVKDKGYKLFIQGVESLNYTDKEMLETVEIINKIAPHSFGIVDTYGAMYKDDVLNLFNMLDRNLDENIAIDFHSHNNMMLSFSFAQEIVEASRGERKVVIDSTLEGVGKGVGNLNTELLMDYLNRKHFYTYDMDVLFDTIDEYISWLKEKHNWSYQIPYFMAGIYSSHANNIIYLMEKHKLSTKDIKHILSMIEPSKRKRYDYDNIEKLYIEYSNSKVDDREVLCKLRTELAGKKALILVPGYSLTEYKQEIKQYIESEKPVMFSVNFISDNPDGYAFFGNPRRYQKCRDKSIGSKIVLTSNIKPKCDTHIVVNYNSLINRGYKYFDNSTIMLLNLLRNVGCEDISIAGFDGFKSNGKRNYFNEIYNVHMTESEYSQINSELEKMLMDFSKTLENKQSIKFNTPSMFEHIFK